MTNKTAWAEGQEPVDIETEIEYGEAFFDLKSLVVDQKELSLRAKGAWRENVVNLSSLSFLRRERELASASASMPFDPATATDLPSLLEQEGKVSFKLDANQLDLEETAAVFGVPSPIRAKALIKVALEGSFSQLEGDGSVELPEVRITGADDILPAKQTLHL